MEANLTQNNDNNMAMLCHVTSFAGFFLPFGNIILPLIVWISNKDKSEFVDHHGKTSLNFQISYMLYVVLICGIAAAFILPSLFISIAENGEPDPFTLFPSIIGWGIGIGALWLISVILVVIASIKAANGERYQYPLTIKFLR